ncbi:MAG TPA: deoxyribonuclease IV [Candidatus Marinimicrobia bacterium]|jgi:deoxyribonuclease-4|nr:deoxyribonuclease IV [Candidatus Neomarinimicrobiota bacterium]MDP6296589.1 deoxyribonuclease IV [Candidatus Neomarinimicrobiota bacterium]MDP7122377.1 deoxyribonuclease IV [Candidatus Neomarinimicrobiota bacterium]MDP7482935.1 deoxyribonuclease IV [Candidatus Neomarinimicrobiota bacterium]MDP7528115.1 deoxyribonuclease IV [Candidatus Neomarinimicrobiota bacterium]|tara:strand:+ start:2893 stop:3756 length:864 start_codon:yes stop_codon:yes gene_type:complete
MGLLGAHVSAAGGVENAPARGTAINADAIQIFTANQNQWFPKEPGEENSKEYREAMKKELPLMTISHASYLLNMGSPEEKKLNMSRRAFLSELDRCDACGVEYVVFHPGSHMKTDEKECLSRISESLNYCLDKRSDGEVTVLIENTAGQGTNVGFRFEHLIGIIEGVERKDRMGVCFDTQHGFASGYDIRTEKGWKETFDEFDKTVDLKWLKAFHINDSKKECGSRVDRHESIGKGLLTMETFWCLVNDDRFTELPMLLETPVDDPSEYAVEIELLRGLVGSKKPAS